MPSPLASGNHTSSLVLGEGSAVGHRPHFLGLALSWGVPLAESVLSLLGFTARYVRNLSEVLSDRYLR